MKRIGALLITLCMICTMVIGCDETVVTGIYPPISADDCEGMMYEEVAAAFETAGFSNIEYEIIDDLITGWLTKDGEVERVTLDGNDDFDTNDLFDASSVMMYRDERGLFGEAGAVTMINNYSLLQSQPRRMPNFWMVRKAN